jgi:NAD-dependent dihydropyrimidine dehydrogenase PreA subunit
MYQKIIFCNCKGEAIDENIKKQAIGLVQQIQAETFEIADLCGQCASNKDQVKELLSSEDKTIILACHSRAVRLVIEFAGINQFDKITFLNLRDAEASRTLNLLEKIPIGNENKVASEKIISNSAWPAWYPVIDYTRCTACGQCADFCLFGVYQKSEGKVEVINPEACKNNCPACARICPQFAIVFPKYVHGGAICGSETFDENEEQKRQYADMDSVLGSDIYQALEQRKAKRQSIIKKEALNKAIEERDNAIKENNY